MVGALNINKPRRWRLIPLKALEYLTRRLTCRLTSFIIRGPLFSTHDNHSMGNLNLDDGRDALHVVDNQQHSRSLSHDSDVELMDMEIMDSEDEAGDDELFRHLNLIRAKTAPAEKTVIRNLAPAAKRPATAPTAMPKRSRMLKTSTLLETLLPEDYDLTVSQHDFSALQCSTQATELAETWTAKIRIESKPDVLQKHNANHTYVHSTQKYHVLDDDDATQDDNATMTADDSTDSDSSEDVVPIAAEKLEDEKRTCDQATEVSLDTTVHAAENVTLEQTDANGIDHDTTDEKENLNLQDIIKKHMIDPFNTTIPVSIAVSNDEMQNDLPIQPGSVTASIPMERPCAVASTGAPDVGVTAVKKRNEVIQPDVQPHKSTNRTSTKSKSTLDSLCSKRTRVPYRVGLSKRANIGHLHSYLKKK